jgi:hypothetical protein
MNKNTNQTKSTHQQEPNGEECSNTFEGKFVSVAGDKLVSTCKDGNEHSHTLAKDAKLTCDGTTCKSSDLKAGSKIRITLNKDDKNVATRVESLNKETAFAHSS